MKKRFYKVKNILFFLFSILAIGIIFNSCSTPGGGKGGSGGSSGGGSGNPSIYNIYIAGSYNNGTEYIPCYWMSPVSGVSTTRIDLPGDGIHSAYAKSIYISDSTIFTCGYYNDGSKYIPCYWIGTTKKDLQGDGIHDAYAESILIYNNKSVEIF